jgi:hypothetical protein
MAWPKGKPRKSVEAVVVSAPEPIRQKRSVRDIVDLLEAYRLVAGAHTRGVLADCEMDIYRQFHVYHNDHRAVDDQRANGCSDRVYGEWELRFRRAFGELKEAA